MLRFPSSVTRGPLPLLLLVVAACYEDDPPGPGATDGALGTTQMAYVCDGSATMGVCADYDGTSSKFPKAIAVGAPFRVVVASPVPKPFFPGLASPKITPFPLVPIAEALATRAADGDCVALREGTIGLFVSSAGQSGDYINVTAKLPRKLKFRHVSSDHPELGATLGGPVALDRGQSRTVAVFPVDDADVPLAGRIAYELATSTPEAIRIEVGKDREGPFFTVRGLEAGAGRIVARGAGLEAEQEVSVR